MNYELNYLDYEDDDTFLSWYNAKCVQTISELSRQVRTLLNYRAAFIYHSLYPKSLNHTNLPDKKFQDNKLRFESIALEYLKLLNNLKKRNVIGDEFQSLLKFRNQNNSSLLKRLAYLTNQIFDLIHYFSEDNEYLTNSFFKMILKIAQEVCKIQMYIKFHQIEFYRELIENYKTLEMALTTSTQNTIQKKGIKTKRGETIKL